MIKIVENIEAVYPLLKQLRPHLTLEQFVTIHDKAKKMDQYCLWGYFDKDHCVGLMGIRLLYDFVHLKHLYIDDLVVDESKRSSGIGGQLLQHAEMLAKNENCTGLRLCTGNENQRGINFYEKQKWKQRALVFKKKI